MTKTLYYLVLHLDLTTASGLTASGLTFIHILPGSFTHLNYIKETPKTLLAETAKVLNESLLELTRENQYP